MGPPTPARPTSDPDGTVVTVVICASRSRSYLRAALESLRRQTMSGDKFEVVLVDTAPWFRDLAQTTGQPGSALPLSVLTLRGAGLSEARNAALAVARGGLVAFLDDDAVAEPDWLERHVAPFVAGRLACQGGRVLPLWTRRRTLVAAGHDRACALHYHT